MLVLSLSMTILTSAAAMVCIHHGLLVAATIFKIAAMFWFGGAIADSVLRLGDK